ncbi:MAG: caspase family protein [Saprospiraceae bacterium]
MNRFFDSLYRIIIVATLSCLWLTDVVSQNKVALVIGIGDYPEESGFRDIHSENDLELIKTYLKQSGFSTSHIHILCNQTATRKRIIQQLTNIIEKELKPGDLFYFHFSGHGQQVQDKDGDEPDGLDEALAAYDARSEYIPGKYQGENHIIDDELDKYLSKARLRLGPTGNVLNTFDACHSGTDTRGIGISRGADHPLVLPDFVSKRTNRTLTVIKRGGIWTKKMAPMVSFLLPCPIN